MPHDKEPAAMIPVNEPRIDGDELRYVSECIQSGWISSAGSFLSAFESRWASYCDRRFGVAVSNGTTALELAVEALDLGPGDEVILPTFTIISCAAAIVRSGAIPVLVDSDRVSWCMDPEQIEARVTPQTRAIMPVHMYGHPAEMDVILDVAERHGLKVIEDAAQAHGARYLSHAGAAGERWRRCGSFGDVSCFSFYANKLITTGEGGMVLTDDERLAERMHSGRNLCFRPQRRFLHEELGHNFRLTNLQAAIGVAQLDRIDAAIAKKRAMGTRYRALLEGAPGLELATESPRVESLYWMFGIVLSEEVPFAADEMARRLEQRGVETRPFFLGMHEQPALLRRGLFKGERYPTAERLARRGLYLPSGLTLTDEQMDKVATAVREALA